MKIFDQEINPGEYIIVRLPAPRIYNFTPIFLPVHVIRGKKPGPILCVTAALHGDEVNGVEIIRRLLKKSFIHSLAGTLIAIPVVNIYGFLFQDRYLPDRRDLNRSFPGSAKGSLASRFAHLISQTVLPHVTHCIDLHTGSLHRTNFPQTRVDADSAEAMMLARAFAAPIILPAPPRSGSLREYAQQHNIPYVLYEAGEASRFDEACIRLGVTGVLGVMRHLKMLPKKESSKSKSVSKVAHDSYWVRSPYGGIFIPLKLLGNEVTKGDVLGIIGHPAEKDEHKIISPITGMIIGRSDAPLIHEGAGVFHIACFTKDRLEAKRIERLQELNEISKEEDSALEVQLDG